jgi:hypothetical protein
MNLFLSLVRRESASSAQRASSSSGRSMRNSVQAKRQANMLMDSVGRMEDRG